MLQLKNLRREREPIRHCQNVTPGGSRKCGKERTCGRVFSDLWQWQGLQAKSWKCGSERT